jgi:hypothetical protein
MEEKTSSKHAKYSHSRDRFTRDGSSGATKGKASSKLLKLYMFIKSSLSKSSPSHSFVLLFSFKFLQFMVVYFEVDKRRST